MSMTFIETSFEMKGISEEGEFSGYAAVFGNIDSHRDIINKGAFLNSISESKGVWPIIDEHWGKQVGWNSGASEDDIGLFVKGKLNLAVDRAKEWHALSKQAQEVGGKMGLSIGYYTKKYSIDEEKEVRFLEEVDVREYSFVTFPSNKRAAVLSMKSIAKDLEGLNLTKDVKAFEGFLREVGFSVSASKKLATTGMQLVKNEPKNLREVDEGEVQELLLAMKMMNNRIEMEGVL